MQQIFDRTVAARIAVRNTSEHIRLRMAVRFSLLYFVFFLLGLLLDRILPIAALPSWKSLFEEALASPLMGDVPARDEIRAVLYAARREMLLLILLLLSGMTMFSERACGVLLSLHGVLFGMLCRGMTSVYTPTMPPSESARLLICALSQFACAAVFLTAAGEAVIFSYRYRDVGRGPRKVREAISVRYVLQALVLFGTLAAIAAIRALLLFALQNMSIPRV